MSLVDKLLRRLNRVWEKRALAVLALRITYDGRMTWTVSDGLLSTAVTGGSGTAFAVALDGLTLAGLASYVAGLPGYRVLLAPPSDIAGLSAAVLVDGSRDQAASNGDHLYAYTNPNRAYLAACATELRGAQRVIERAPAMMDTRTSEGAWLDYLGSFYAVPRLLGELDAAYGPRIPVEVLRPRGNNKAIQAAILEATGQRVQVLDVIAYGEGFPDHSGAIRYDGTYTYNANNRPIYGLFDVVAGFDLLGAVDFAAYGVLVRGLVERLRDAGTQLRALSVLGSTIGDDDTPGDGDDASLVVATVALHDGSYGYDGTLSYAGANPAGESLIG